MKHTPHIRLFALALCLGIHPMALAQTGNCDVADAEATLEVGNIRARVYNNGSLFWKGRQNLYEAPKGSGLHSIFSSSFLIGGLIDNSLRMSASSYGPFEFWPGPLDANGNPPADCSTYDQLWEIRSEDFEQYELQGVFSANMLNWPWELGAPVVDGDGNPDNYNLEGGDRPELLGDQMLWWVMNDRGNEHRWSETEPIGLEVHGSAFAFEHGLSGGDITFYRYRIINKNTASLTNAFAGMFVDPDLGNASDDYFGSDSLLHLGYAYNADPVDENVYEDTPPAIGYTFLITPEAQLDERDNDYDGELDEPGETTGLYAALRYSGYLSEPSNGSEMYTFMQGLWIDGQPFTVGGYGRDFSTQPTRYGYSGDPVTQSYWTELKPFPDGGQPNRSGDRQFMVSTGPFTLFPQVSKDIVIALVWAQGNDYLDSVRKLKNITASMQEAPNSYVTTGYRPELIDPLPPEPQQVLGFDQNFPNPFTGTTIFRYSLPKTMQVRLAVYDILGREVATLAEGSQEAGIYSLDFDGTDLPPGIYYAQIELDHLRFTRKMVRVP